MHTTRRIQGKIKDVKHPLQVFILHLYIYIYIFTLWDLLAQSWKYRKERVSYNPIHTLVSPFFLPLFLFPRSQIRRVLIAGVKVAGFGVG